MSHLDWRNNNTTEFEVFPDEGRNANQLAYDQKNDVLERSNSAMLMLRKPSGII
jgi:hypothetical protein